MSKEHSPPLGALDAGEFLNQYWQKRPLLVRRAFPGFKCPVDADELAGLACDRAVESRLVIEKGGLRPWELREGPFTEKTFRSLPETHWTMLVQGVDSLLPQVNDLFEYFRFIPDWRTDDIMISYAVDSGGVGPHVDNYDVFLLQGLGQRRWRIDRRPIVNEEYVPGLRLRILKQFTPTDEWILEPGDMLYLPPGIAHWGTAVGECMTMSIGFRAPSHQHILIRYLKQQLERLDPEVLYQDPGLRLQDNSAEITSQAIDRVLAIIDSYKPERSDVARWFGSMVTEPREDWAKLKEQPLLEEELRSRIGSGSTLRRTEGVRMAYTIVGQTSLLFINGEVLDLVGELSVVAPLICNNRRLTGETLLDSLKNNAVLEMLTKLYNRGFFYFTDDDG